MLPHQHLGDLSLRGRPYSFRFRTSLMAAFSSVRSAYLRFNFAFSASSSRRRFTSDTEAPPYLLRHLKKVALLTRTYDIGRPLAPALGVLEDSNDLGLAEFRLPHGRSKLRSNLRSTVQ